MLPTEAEEWAAAGSEDTELGVLMEPEVDLAPCPVYAAKEILDLLHLFPIHDRREMPTKNP